MSYEKNAVGIDVSNGRSTVSVLRPFGEVVVLPFNVQHTTEELSALADKLLAIDGETRVVMEHTGRYYESIEKVLHNKGLFVSAVNPLLIKQYGNNSLRNVKTDKADSMKIARYALDNWLVSLTEQVFPGIRKIFESPVRKDGTQKWVDFITTFWHADCVRKQSLNAFTERYRKWCKRHGYLFKVSNAEEVYALAKTVIVLVPKDSITKTIVQEAARQLTAISRSVETYRAEMNRLASMLPEYEVVMNMYGAGESTGPQLMAEIGDVTRFERKQSLVAFAGVDPVPKDSGDKQSRSNKSSKRGSPYLRKTLFNIMSTILQNAPEDEPVYQFLDKKRSEGKPYYVYMTAGANKFLRRYYAKVTEYLKEKEKTETDSNQSNTD